MSRVVAPLAVLAGVLAPAAGAASSVTRIPNAGPTVLPAFVGHAAQPHPLPPPGVPQNPFLAPNPFNNVHNDTWMSDTYPIAGPLGRSSAAFSSILTPANTRATPFFLCGGGGFDSHDRLLTTCSGGTYNRTVLVDPVSLQALAWYDLPPTPTTGGSLGAAYNYIDNRDRVFAVTETNHIWVLAEPATRASTSFTRVADYDLSGLLGEDKLTALVPDFSGPIWFVSSNGIVGLLNPVTGDVRTVRLNEGIANGFPVDRTGAYIATNRAIYRFGVSRDGTPYVVWSAPYQNIGQTKPGQFAPGTGSTPTLLDGGKYVTIADNANQMHVVVYRTATRLARYQRRTICQVPVFARGRGATENSLTGSGRSIIVENNYGYSLNPQTLQSTMSVPGIARVDITPKGNSCRLVWTNRTVAGPSVVPKLSTKTGLVYLYVKHKDPKRGVDVWYWTAVDFHSGKTVWERLSGTGPLYNNHYTNVAIGPTGTAYLGVLGGLVAMRDTR